MTAEFSYKDEARRRTEGLDRVYLGTDRLASPMVRDDCHDSVYLFGAICHTWAVGAAMAMPTVNTEAMNEHLQEISTQVASDAHALLICGGAGWHQPGERLIVPDNITLTRLPLYSPEFSPMENAWDYLRGNILSSLVWDSYYAIVKACKHAWQFPINDPERIASIGNTPWACVNL